MPKAEDDDWRLNGQEAYLAERTLVWSTWFRYREDWDHDHSAFCTDEISDQPIDGHVLHNAGWVTADDHYTWICGQCFDDFRDRFRWKVAPSA